MRKFQLLLLVSLMSFAGFAQKHNIQGILTAENGETLPAATVLLLNASDSVMSQFGISRNDGYFQLKGINTGSYILQVSFIGYELFYQNVEVNGNVDLSKLVLKKASYELNEVTLEDYRVPMRIKDDTIAYDAKAFTTKPNAVVEDLLEKLPGVEVESDGSIKAQGEDVQHIFVDGKEFFGDDPTIATKNLPADAIDKVEVYDKLSDMAEFTGIEDGNEEKAINLVLNEDAKAGYFGNVYGGGGYDPALYESKVMINRFTKNNQTSILGLSNNNNEGGFSIRDYISFMGGIQSLMDNGGAVMLSPGDFSGASADGLTRSSAVGFNYNRDWGKKTKLRSSYFLNNVKTDLQQNTDRFYAEQRGFDESVEDLDQESKGGGHKINLRLKHKIDSAQKVQLRGSIAYNKANLTEQVTQLSYLENDLQNSFVSQQLTNSNQWKGDGEFSYRKQVNKAGRSFSAQLFYDGSADEQLAQLDQTSLNSGDLDQRQLFRNWSNNYSTAFSYTEPLGGRLFLNSDLSYGVEKDNLDKKFYDYISEDVDVLNEGLSRVFESKFDHFNAGLEIDRKAKKFKWGMGLETQLTSFAGEVVGMPVIRKNYVAFLPNADLRYKVSGAKTLRLNYRSTLDMPSMDQLQPLVDNSNPQRIYIGNSNLEAATRHRLSMRYMSFNQFNFTSFNIYTNGTYTKNAIQNAVTTDSLGRQVLSPVNTAENYQASVSSHFSAPIRAIGMKFRISASESYNRSLLPIDQVINTMDRFVHSGGIKIENRKKEKIDFGFGTNFSASSTNYSEESRQKQFFFSTDYFAETTLYLKKDWSVSGSFSYQVYADQGFGNQESFPFVDFEVSKLFLKDKKGELSLRCTDALNQNRGLNRSTQWNYIEERTSNNLGRFVMLRFSYSLKGFGDKAEKGRGGNWHAR